jgi:hypothetical protein
MKTPVDPYLNLPSLHQISQVKTEGFALLDVIFARREPSNEEPVKNAISDAPQYRPSNSM